MGGIYYFKNKINNKYYIGQTKDFKDRYRRHKNCYHHLDKSYSNWKIYQAMRKYGFDNFEFGILEECDENLNEREIYYITKYDSYKNGYNSTRGGNYFSDNVNSQESIQKRKQSLIESKKLQDENHPLAKITEEEVIQARKRYILGESIKDIYKDYPQYKTLESFKNMMFLHWKTAEVVISAKEKRYTNAKLTNEEVSKIRQRYLDGEEIKDIYKDYSQYKNVSSFKDVVFKGYKNASVIITPEQHRGKRQKIPIEWILDIRQRIYNGELRKDILQDYKNLMSESSFYNIINYKTHTHIQLPHVSTIPVVGE